ncbi:MAG: carboxyl transferase domain-containing protein [Actinomycetota bacterium]
MNGLEEVVDPGTFARVYDDLESSDPLHFPGYRALLERARSRGADESVVAGTATIRGHPVVAAGFDFGFLGGSLGEVAGERLARALMDAAERSLPFVLRTTTGGARMQEGMRALIQMPKMVAARRVLADAHQPFIAVLADPTTGGVLASLGALADVTIAQEGSTLGFAGPRVVEAATGRALPEGSHTAAAAFARGAVDALLPHSEIAAYVARVLGIVSDSRPEPVPIETDDIGRTSDAPRDGWEVVTRARSEQRPRAPALLREMADDAIELRGDRGGGDDPALVAAVVRIAGRRAAALALDRAHAPGPGAFRKARRCLEVAARLRLPVVTLVDTPGADPSAASEAGGIAWEIARTFDAFLALPVPVVAVVTGEGGSGGALALATADRLVAYEGSIFSVIRPEAAAAILWRDPERAPDAARVLQLGARALLELGIADRLAPEPLSAPSLRALVAQELDGLGCGPSGEALAEARRARWRAL